MMPKCGLSLSQVFMNIGPKTLSCSLYNLQGVTYCGESKASSLTMDNVPWHTEVVQFVQQLVDLLPDYEIASEHAHSNCVLVAHTKVGSVISIAVGHHARNSVLNFAFLCLLWFCLLTLPAGSGFSALICLLCFFCFFFACSGSISCLCLQWFLCFLHSRA